MPHRRDRRLLVPLSRLAAQPAAVLQTHAGSRAGCVPVLLQAPPTLSLFGSLAAQLRVHVTPLLPTACQSLLLSLATLGLPLWCIIPLGVVHTGSYALVRTVFSPRRSMSAKIEGSQRRDPPALHGNPMGAQDETAQDHSDEELF